MKRTSFAAMECPIARALERAGERWSMLILRDAFLGLRRFSAFRVSLGISENSPARRLNDLVDQGLLERSRYREYPVRYEYVLTDAGRDFLPVLIGLARWGIRHDRPGQSYTVLDPRTGERQHPVLVDRRTGREITGHDALVVPDQPEHV